MDKVTLTQSATIEKTIGRIVISLDDAYISILGMHHDLSDKEHAAIKAIVESKLNTRPDITSVSIGAFELSEPK